VNSENTGRPAIPPGEFMGHPKALWQLSNVEMWERFSFYGMRALLAVYVATTFFGHLGEQANAQASLVYGGYTAMVYATGILGGYIADHVLGYQRSILLGAIIMSAGLFVLLVEDLTWFLVGLSLIVAGNGLFKPNISTMIGKLYEPGDVRRDSGFTVFYMSINLGAFIAPFVTASWIGVQFGMKWGFFAAAIGMVLSTLFLEVAKRSLGPVGRPAEGKEGWGMFFLVGIGALLMSIGVYFLLSESSILGILLLNIMAFVILYFFSSSYKAAALTVVVGTALWAGLQLMMYQGAEGGGFLDHIRANAFDQVPLLAWCLVVVLAAIVFMVRQLRVGDKVQVQRYIAMVILFVANACFWALFEQAGSSLNFFAREFVSPIQSFIPILSFSGEEWANGGFGIFQSLNPLYILLFAPAFAALWPWLDKRNMNPSIPRKFALGLIQVALGFYVLVFAIANFQNAAGLVPWIFLALTYLLHTTGELCLSPIGLSMVTKLAAEKETGMAMGGWFLSVAMAQYVAGLIAAIASGGSGGGEHGPAIGATIGQYSDTYWMLFLIGLGFGVVYLVVAPLINKLMHGVK
jgi:POT family proton-dependent oligopeptide transporter